MKIARWVAPILLVGFALGCGKSPNVAEGDSTQSPTSPAVAHETPGNATTPADGDTYVQQPVVNTPAAVLPVDPDSPPEKVVTEFLNAMKSSDDGVAAGLLTAKAREETAKHSLAVQPPGSPNAEYQVSEAEVDAEDPNIAQVGCLWTERDTEGGEHTEQVVWVLSKQPEGWRVFGMGTQMPTRKDPVFFNFEDPAEMTTLMEEIAQEMAAATEPVAGGDETIRQAETEENSNSLR